MPGAAAFPQAGATRGFVFAATRPRHRALARRAARSLRQVAPGAVIDLFADEPVDDPVFDKVHVLQRKWHRPKIEALRRSRFERTIYLDSDIIAVADPSDIFDLLDRFDLAGVHDNNRNSDNALKVAGDPVPASFPSVNSGVLGVVRNDRTARFLQAWEARISEHGHRVDQPSLRSLLWECDLRIAILPIDYNLMAHPILGAMGPHMTAPRLIHMREINKYARDPGDPEKPYDLTEFYPARRMRRLRAMLAADRTLSATGDVDKTWSTLMSGGLFGFGTLGTRLRSLRLRYLVAAMARYVLGKLRGRH